MEKLKYMTPAEILFNSDNREELPENVTQVCVFVCDGDKYEEVIDEYAG